MIDIEEIERGEKKSSRPSPGGGYVGNRHEPPQLKAHLISSSLLPMTIQPGFRPQTRSPKRHSLPALVKAPLVVSARQIEIASFQSSDGR